MCCGWMFNARTRFNGYLCANFECVCVCVDNSVMVYVCVYLKVCNVCVGVSVCRCVWFYVVMLCLNGHNLFPCSGLI